ncbi:hypothetical protein AZ270_gp14 [Acidianus tailed spindle virus]|uniref:hypothetical protein n=1 Tax=Acidianus tailed spindle virus TaxID=1797140 RepID=UPI00076F2B56|nr:hypothetical protein AZ270_gp14 [Acidianus tailed spindle virus]AME30037.1 hypothetical protein ATSV_C212 [Acidianus tailed spindle virus]
MINERWDTENRLSQYIPLYLLRFTLPSKFLAKERTSVDKKEDYTNILITINNALASKLESIRRSVYEEIGKGFVYIELMGWIAVDDNGVNHANIANKRIVDELTKVVESGKVTFRDGRVILIPPQLIEKLRRTIANHYYVKAIRILVDYDNAKEIIEQALSQLREGIETLQQKIQEAEAEKKLASLRKYQSDRQKIERLYESFLDFYKARFS